MFKVKTVLHPHHHRLKGTQTFLWNHYATTAKTLQT